MGIQVCVKLSVAAAIPCAVPPFVIQPLVENALRHGLGTRVDGGEIRISVQRTATALHAVVEDSGSGFQPRWREGTGLSNLRQRLAAQYGDAAAVVIADAVPGARVEVRVPIAGDT